MEVEAHVCGIVWKIVREVGDDVVQGEPLVILESMKMEVPVESPVSGRVTEVRCAAGDAVEEEQVVAVVQSR